jgi:hypothetical protein
MPKLCAWRVVRTTTTLVVIGEWRKGIALLKRFKWWQLHHFILAMSMRGEWDDGLVKIRLLAGDKLDVRPGRVLGRTYAYNKVWNTW